MTKDDTDIVRQLLLDVLATHTAKIDGKFELIKQELGQIKEQTIKTNGRVNRHDEAINLLKQSDIDQLIHSPLECRLKQIESNMIAQKSVNDFKTKTFAVVIALLTLFVAYLEIYLK